MEHEELSDFFCWDNGHEWAPVGGTPFPSHIHPIEEGDLVTDPTLMGESISPLSSETITTRLPFASLSKDQVMADVGDRWLGEPRGLPVSSVLPTEPHGMSGTTLGDGSSG